MRPSHEPGEKGASINRVNAIRLQTSLLLSETHENGKLNSKSGTHPYEVYGRERSKCSFDPVLGRVETHCHTGSCFILSLLLTGTMLRAIFAAGKSQLSCELEQRLTQRSSGWFHFEQKLLYTPLELIILQPQPSRCFPKEMPLC